MIRKLQIGFILVLIWTINVAALAPAFGAAASDGHASYSDIEGHWASASIDKWSSHGVLQGSGGGLFRPENEMSRAEFVMIVNRLFGLRDASAVQFADVPADAWYASSMRIARSAGYYKGYPNGEARPLERIARQDAVTLLVRAFALESPAENGSSFAGGFKDANRIAGYAREAVEAMQGVVKGYPNGEFGPDRFITRSEAVALLDQMVGAYYPAPGIHSEFAAAGHAIVNSPGVVLRDARIAGNLYFAPGIGDGEAELDGISVSGTTFVLGGGERSIRLIGSTLAALVVHGTNGAASLEIGEGTSVGRIVVVGGHVSINGKSVPEGEHLLENLEVVPVVNAPAPEPAGGGDGSSGGESLPVANVVDPNATDETRSLFLYLNEVRGQQVLFGHQHATDEGLTLTPSSGVLQSEVRNSVGDFPAVFGWDTLSLDGKEEPGVADNAEQSRSNLAESVKSVHRLGGIVTLSAHMPNFVTGGSYNDTSGSVVENILPGGSRNEIFNQYLNNIASFAHQAKDDNGKPIPILFRPFHEQNGGWFWWGAKTTSKSQYIELFRYTVEYLRDKKGVRNFLYAFSPNGTFGGDESVYLTTYPGDDYVDVLGMDQYDNQQTPGTAGFIDNLVKDLKMVSRLADSKGKVAVFSEFGYSPSGMLTTGNADKQWFTRLLTAIQSDPDAKRIAYMQTWANFGLDGNLFVPYKNAPGLGDHELLPDFVDFYRDPYTAFLGDVRNVYGKASRAARKGPFMHIASPANDGTVRDGTTVIRARALHFTPVRTTYSINGSGEEFPMALDRDGFYYEADWSPTANLNGKQATITVRAYKPDGSVLQQTVTVIVKIGEILMKAYPFDSGIESIRNNGTYPETMSLSLSHSSFGDGKALRLGVSNAVYADAWQEWKLELPGLSDSLAIADVHRIKLDAWIPLAAGGRSANASARAIVMLPPDWETKYGMTTTWAKLTDLPVETIDNVLYAKYSPVIDLNEPAKSALASGLAISLVGGELDLPDGSIFVDNIRLYNVYEEAPQDPALVDDFESYLGSDAELAKKFVHAGGDKTTVALDGTYKSGGDYALKFGYTLAGSGYSGIARPLGSVDWSSFNSLKFWMKPDGSNQKLVIQLKIDGVSFEAYPSLAGTTPDWVSLHFKDFSAAPWDTGNAGKKITKTGLQNVQEMSIYVNSVEGATLSGSLYFDDIKAIDDGTGGVPNGGGDSGGNPAPHGTLYGFEADTDGWKVEQNEASAGAPALSTGAAAEGLRSLASAFSLAGVSFELAKVGALDLSQAAELRAKVKLSAGQAQARLYVKTGSGWAWHDSGTPTAVDSSGFATLSLPLTGIADLDRVQSIGIKLETFSGAGTATVYLDDVYLDNANPAGTPTETG